MRNEDVLRYLDACMWYLWCVEQYGIDDLETYDAEIQRIKAEMLLWGLEDWQTVVNKLSI